MSTILQSHSSTNTTLWLVRTAADCGRVSVQSPCAVTLESQIKFPGEASLQLSKKKMAKISPFSTLGYAYCIRTADYTPPDASPTTTAPPTTTTGVEAPTATHSGQPANCNKWHVVVDGDTCSTIPADEGITSAQFFEWNPAVSSDCLTNFWLGYSYCVGVSGGSATTTTAPPATTTTSAPAVPSPTQDGNAVSNCNAYAQAQDGDWCAAFAERNEISLVDLYAWNSVLGADGENCGGSFWALYWYCIGVA